MLRNCVVCGNLFTSPGGGLRCRACVQEENQAFDRVRAYLRDEPQAAMAAIVEATGVDQDKILHFIRQGRLIVKGSGDRDINRCDLCGTTISRGRLCNSCAGSLRSRGAGGEGAEGEGEAPEQRRMYALNRRHEGRYLGGEAR